MIDFAHLDIGIGARYAQTLTAGAIDQSRLDDRRGLAHQPQHVDAVAFVEALAPRRLDGPIHLARNPVQKPLNARARRARFRAQVQVERTPLVEVTEPGFARAAGDEWQDDRREEGRKILLKQRSAKTEA
jgi:hypothetical protein